MTWARGEATHESVVGGEPPSSSTGFESVTPQIFISNGLRRSGVHSEWPHFPLPTQLHVLMDRPALTVRSLQTSARPEQGTRRKSTLMNRGRVEFNTVTAQIYSVGDL